METANVETSAAASVLIDQLQATLVACLLLEYEHEALRQLSHALNNINSEESLMRPGSYFIQLHHQNSSMCFTELPPELILAIGPHLSLAACNALIQTTTLFAELLTPQLYDAGLRVTPDLDDWLHDMVIKPRGVIPRRMQDCMHTWSSSWIMSFFLPKHQDAYVALVISPLANALAILPLTHVLAMTGNLTILSSIIAATGDPDPLDKVQWTPLQYAASYGHVESVQRLLDVGANVLSEAPGGVSTVYAASFCSGTPDTLSLVIEATRKAGGEVMKRNEFGDTPLHLAALVGNKLTTMCLIDAGAEPLDTNSDGDVAAAAAIICGHEEIALLLIERMIGAGGNISLPNGDGWTLLHHATKYSSEAVVCALLEAGTDLSLADGEGKTPLEIALERSQNDKIIDLLLERSTHTSISNHTRARMFDDAVRARELNRAQALLRKCPPPWPKEHINSLLWKSAGRAAKLELQQFDVMMDLAESGSSALHFTNEGGWSALHYLCSAQPANSATAREMIHLLINEGMNLNSKNCAGLTPMHRAIYTKNRVAIQLLFRGYCTRKGRLSIPDFEPVIDSLMKLDMGVSSLVMDRNGYTGIDRAVMAFKDEQVRAVFGMLLGWPGVK
ncbi:ankyrin repeat-containing domain protein [Aspergillus germanicus]